jgi:hypothetical protein
MLQNHNIFNKQYQGFLMNYFRNISWEFISISGFIIICLLLSLFFYFKLELYENILLGFLFAWVLGFEIAMLVAIVVAKLHRKTIKPSAKFDNHFITTA